MVGALLANGVRTFSNVHAAKLPVTAIAPLKGSCRGVPVLIEDKHILNILLHFEFLSQHLLRMLYSLTFIEDEQVIEKIPKYLGLRDVEGQTPAKGEGAIRNDLPR